MYYKEERSESALIYERQESQSVTPEDRTKLLFVVAFHVEVFDGADAIDCPQHFQVVLKVVAAS